MISPDMFEKFGMPSLRAQVDCLNAAEYHLDGPGALQHIEQICSIDKISVIQWQPGAGKAASQNWTDVYHTIDSLGRGTVMWASKNDIRKYSSMLNMNHSFYKTTDMSKSEIEAVQNQYG
ncbi:MAG: hypothetical protein GF350_02880 [Chitinivibrionales bacterium]|nr:hypothetical protein [Chitinivibrionales bacterium]